MVDGWTTVNFDPSAVRYGSNFANIYVSGTGDTPQNAIYWNAAEKFIANKVGHLERFEHGSCHGNVLILNNEGQRFEF